MMGDDPASDINVAIKASRIIGVLDQVISRANLVGALKSLTKNDGQIIKQVLDPDTHIFVVRSCDRYQTQWAEHKNSSSTIQNSENSNLNESTGSDKGSNISGSYNSVMSKTPSEKSEISESERHDSALSKALYILEENEKVQKLVQSLRDEMSPAMKYLIKNLQEYKNKMENRLYENAAQYKAKEKYLREIYEKNEVVIREIKTLQEELVVTKTNNNFCLIGRNILINRHQNKIQKIKQNSMEAIQKKVNASEKAMVNDWKTSMIEQDLLKNELNAISEKYSQNLKDHLATEKILRAKRTKVENQVLGWIQKFDQDIGEKQAEEEAIQALLDEEVKEVSLIQEKLDEQQEEYDELMQEKAEYEEEMLERRLYQFLVNRSARTIQRTYRLYKARKLAKKVSKKGKKGKKK